MKTKRFRVTYAGQPQTAVFLSASSWEEAAFLFFSNTPLKESIIVEASHMMEKDIRPDELAKTFPDVSRILAEHEGKSGLVDQWLKEKHHMASTAEHDQMEEDGMVGHLVLKAIALLVTIVFAIIYAYS